MTNKAITSFNSSSTTNNTSSQDGNTKLGYIIVSLIISILMINVLAYSVRNLLLAPMVTARVEIVPLPEESCAIYITDFESNEFNSDFIQEPVSTMIDAEMCTDDNVEIKPRNCRVII